MRILLKYESIASMEMSQLEYTIAILAILIVFIIILRYMADDLKNKLVKKKKVEARLITKTSKEVVTRPVFRDNFSNVNEGVVEKINIPILIFEHVITRELLEFEVEENIFKIVNEGDLGCLIYKGRKFLVFKNIKANMPKEKRIIKNIHLNE